MTKKQTLRVIMFIVVVFFVLFVINKILVQPAVVDTNARYHAFYKAEPENTWDGVLLGSSVVDRAWAAPLAWHEQGIALYAMSIDSLPLPFVTSVMKEVRKKQDTNFFIIDLRGLRSSKLELQEFKIRRLTDNMEFSKNRNDTLKKAFDYVEKYNVDKSFLDDKLSFYIPFIKYHSRWNQLTKEDFLKPETKMKGVYMADAFKIRATKKPRITSKVGELTDLQTDILTEILEYGKKNDLQLLFTVLPAPLAVSAQHQMNKAFEIIDSYGYNVLNFNNEEIYKEMDLDFSTDFYNTLHLNSKGARKVTSYLSKYIVDTYNIKDKRGEESYKSWDEAWNVYDNYYFQGWEEVKNTKPEGK